MEKSGWEKFVRDNALGDHEFLTFTHKGKMRFAVNIFKKDGTEIIQPPQSRAFLASSSRIKTEQDVKMEEEVVVPSELSSLGAEKIAPESNGGGMEKRRLTLGRRKLMNPKTPRGLRKWLVSGEIQHAPLRLLLQDSTSLSRKHTSNACGSRALLQMNIYRRRKQMLKIHHPDGKKSWDVVYLANKPQALFSAGWTRLFEEYLVVVGDTCKFSVIKPNELLLIISKP